MLQGPSKSMRRMGSMERKGTCIRALHTISLDLFHPSMVVTGIRDHPKVRVCVQWAAERG